MSDKRAFLTGERRSLRSSASHLRTRRSACRPAYDGWEHVLRRSTVDDESSESHPRRGHVHRRPGYRVYGAYGYPGYAYGYGYPVYGYPGYPVYGYPVYGYPVYGYPWYGGPYVSVGIGFRFGGGWGHVRGRFR